MNNLKVFFASVMLAATTTANAGGILTNTNQSIDFLRNPARDAAIGLDGVYSNPAGVAFLPEGFHIAFNWQYAHQTRTITSNNPLYALGRKNNGITPPRLSRVLPTHHSSHHFRVLITEVTGAGSSTSLCLVVAVAANSPTDWALSRVSLAALPIS